MEICWDATCGRPAFLQWKLVIQIELNITHNDLRYFPSQIKCLQNFHLSVKERKGALTLALVKSIYVDLMDMCSCYSALSVMYVNSQLMRYACAKVSFNGLNCSLVCKNGIVSKESALQNTREQASCARTRLTRGLFTKNFIHFAWRDM